VHGFTLKRPTPTFTVILAVSFVTSIIGGKITDWLGKKDVPRTVDAEFAFNDGRLAAA
jgi:hypothetical protein